MYGLISFILLKYNYKGGGNMNAKKLYCDAVAQCDKKLKSMIPYQSVHSGGFLDESLGFCAVTHFETGAFLQAAVLSYCSEESEFFNDFGIYERIISAVNYIKTKQRASGLIDLRERNYDSPPDTAFLLALICRCSYTAKNAEKTDCGKMIFEALKPLAVSFADAICRDGGFHTPNHRWIIAGALCAATDVFGEINAADEAAKYFREGLDLNSDGIYSEKSIYYSAKINSKLMDAYFLSGEKYFAESIVKNCRCILTLMSADTSLLTSISIRQDNGKHVFPTEFLSSFYFAGKYSGDLSFFSAIDEICSKNPPDEPGLIYIFRRNPEWLCDNIDTESFKRPETVFLKDTGIWAYHKNEADAFLMCGTNCQMCVRFGDVFIKSIKIFAPYYHEAVYTGREMCKTENGAKMHIRPTYGIEQRVHMPGFWNTLPRKVEFPELPYNNIAERRRSPRADVEYILEALKTDDGIDVKVSSNGGIDGAHFALEFEFELPGAVITGNTFEEAQTPRNILLTDGFLTFRKGTYSVNIGPGFFAHKMISDKNDSCKVSMTADLPIEKTVHIRFIKLDGSEPEYYYTQEGRHE